MDGDIELEDQALDALLAVMFTERSRVSVSPQSHQSSVGGCDDSDSEQEIPRTPAINCDGLLEDHLLCDKAGSNASTPAIKRPSLSEYQIVTFDVGGQVFRCRAGRILSFPAKRLAQLITCGCARMQNSDVSFFVDRNPTHFQRILDWYRSPADAIAASVVHKDHSFQEDARYFDLYDEFFAHASKNNALSVPPRPPRQQIETTLAKVSSQTFKHALSRPRSLQELSTMPIYPVSKPVKGLRSNKSPSYQEEESTTRTLQFVKRECQTLVSETSPCIYIVRKDEELHVARVKGSGRLLLRVCDVTGMKQLHVAQAVLFDSHASFFKQDEWISLGHQGRLPGDHTYTFWLESNDSKSSKSKTSSTMQVEFTLLSSFQWNQRVDSNLRSHGAIPDAPALASLNSLALLSPSLMLPPQQQYSVMNSGTRKDSSERIQSQPVCTYT